MLFFVDDLHLPSKTNDDQGGYAVEALRQLLDTGTVYDETHSLKVIVFRIEIRAGRVSFVLGVLSGVNVSQMGLVHIFYAI